MFTVTWILFIFIFIFYVSTTSQLVLERVECRAGRRSVQKEKSTKKNSVGAHWPGTQVLPDYAIYNPEVVATSMRVSPAIASYVYL